MARSAGLPASLQAFGRVARDHAALRALGNRLVGILHGCLQHHTAYDEHTAWAHIFERAA